MAKSMKSILLFKLCSKIEHGTLTVKTPDGDIQHFGDGLPKAEVSIHDWAMLDAVLQRGDIGLGESYVEGFWDSPNVEDFLTILINNQHLAHTQSRGNQFQNLLFRFTNVFMRRNSRAGSSKNIQAHYDVGNEFYKLWLDETMSYSSGLYETQDETLKDAQHNKYDRLISMLPKTAENVLEIGCGWGGFAERAADQGRNVTGITISPAQYEYSKQRLGSRSNIELRDYRDIDQKYDSIVSIEMIEAVGENYWREYFRKIKDSLADGGRAAIQRLSSRTAHLSATAPNRTLFASTFFLAEC